MTEIKTNTVLPQQKNVAVQNSNNYYTNPGYIPAEARTIKDEFVHQHKKNGLFERLYNQLKNLTGFGVGSKKAQDAVNKAESGEITEEEARKTIDKYRKSQANSEQAFGDVMSVGASGMTFFTLNKWFKYATAGVKVNSPIVNLFNNLTKEIKTKLTNNTKVHPKDKKFITRIIKFYETSLKTVSSNKRMLAIAAGCSAVIGGLVKWGTLKLNRIGSDEFKTNKKDFNGAKTPYDKALYKAQRKETNKQRRGANFRNFASGAVNGLMMPLGALGALVATPLYLVGNSLNRYFIGNHEDKKKSFDGYMQNLKDDAFTHASVAVATAIPLAKKAQWTKIFNENIAKATRNITSKEMINPDFEGTTAYKQLEKLLLESKSVSEIIEDSWLTVDEKIKALTKENIFAAKMKQICNDGSNLARVLKEECPATRDIKGAQTMIDEALGTGYEVKKLLGVGTIAETYLVKSPDGKEVCIKILKDGITEEKILKDKDAFIELVNKLADKTDQEKEFLIRNIDDLSSTVLKEVNLETEMANAKKLAQCTTKADVVKPIKCKNGVYVMEKAKGISLSSFLKLNRLYAELEVNKNLGLPFDDIQCQIDDILKRTPDFKDIKFDKKDTEYILSKYQEMIVEQFHKVDKKGKIIHGDLHNSNVMIDPEALKSRKGNLFSLIDAGNIIEMSPEQSLRALNMINYIKKGDTHNIAEYVLDGAVLPAGMNKEKALEIIEKELKELFFNPNIKLNGKLNEEKILGYADNIMQKHNIVSGSSQLSLNKCKISAENSITGLKKALDDINNIELMQQDSTIGALSTASGQELKKLGRNKLYESMIAKQEKENLKQLPKEIVKKHSQNSTAPKDNSVEYITYKLKQHIIDMVSNDL